MKQPAALLLVLLLLASAASARDIFVDNVGGDDRHDGGAPTSAIQGSGPCRTIAQALRLAQKGDRIILANTGQPYRESITLQGGRHSGFPHRPLTIEGNGATLDGSFPVPDYAWEHVAGDVFRFRPRLKSYQQLFRNDRPLVRRRVERGRRPELQPLEWCLFERAIYFRVEPDRLPQDYHLTFAGHPVGITLYEVRHVVIRDLIVQGYQLDGINAHDNVLDARIESTVCRGNGRSGISIGGASRVRLQSCVVGDNGAAQVRTEGFCRCWITDCKLIGNTAPELMREGGEVIMESQVSKSNDGR